ncbi:hypothetical protein AGABI1DRAFT_88327 [Agaricus bisporus var. burnettii JB137-S8]|uniref:Aminoglycoside phosphotransferase domain-containing protein n=1 Tax=Agaricus bisporus var. burnettii (strain JB137-S8 / ATCC MYA-4627 / FGSC 10392) TaxID=597362 RepID=K5XHT9_AGABU|nr:uncharacterized protein AGABI1DRAFT_88327 [Agaricus bisporus var. burnettii JB137-S8]EKM73995.1 hypothetical protein AGABI1DRAFT_88327 [Agaricus bisporus var. burnettii JB137-S8]
MPSAPFDIALEDTIVEACIQHLLKFSLHLDDYRLCLVVNGFFVKFNNYVDIYPEYETLKYISQCAKNDINAPRVPEIVHFFHREDLCWEYLVMENINLTPPPEDFFQRVAKAIQWLHDCPVPPDGARIGPVGSGRARHWLFWEYEAPLEFSSLLALERFLNRAIEKLPPQGRASTAPISISHEQLVFMQSDMDESNFGVDDEGRTCLFDFTTVGLLPESFASYTMSLTPNQRSMCRVASILVMSSGPLGLDKDGNPVPPRRRLTQASRMKDSTEEQPTTERKDSSAEKPEPKIKPPYPELDPAHITL